MERAKCLFIAMLLAVVSAIGNTHQTDIYNAYIRGDMGAWKDVISKMEVRKDMSDKYMFELMNYEYGYIAWCLNQGEENEASKHLKQAEIYQAQLELKTGEKALLNAYKSAFYGFHIGLNSFKAPFIGPLSVQMAQKAMALDDTEAFGFVQYGNIYFYMPTLFGGSKSTAVIYYQKAETRMEAVQGNNPKDWNYLNLLLQIASSFEELANYAEAKRYYEKILRIEPAFGYIKNERYPQVLKKL